jgi:hypothetical protein
MLVYKAAATAKVVHQRRSIDITNTEFSPL